MRIATTTYTGRIKRGLEFKNNNTLWFALGQTDPWPNDQSPPSPDPGQTSVNEPFIAFRPAILSMAAEITQDQYNLLPDASKAIVVIDQVVVYLQLFADTDAYTNIARYVYLRGVSNPALGYPGKTFRQVGVYTNLVPAAGYENNQWLVPTNITSFGQLEYVDNGGPVNQDNTGPVVVVAVALEFK